MNERQPRAKSIGMEILGAMCIHYVPRGGRRKLDGVEDDRPWMDNTA